jgi:tryptophan halogenase
MSYKTDKIVIVGGGSAGWMSAATLIRFFPNKDITLIESPDIPIVGVGESTLGFIRAWTASLGIDEKDFMKHTDASYKLSIKFTDFYKKNSGGFHYPFGIPHFNPNNKLGLNDWGLKKTFYPDTPVQDYCRTYFPAMALIENNKISRNEGGEFAAFRFDNDVAYHFDATKFGLWLRDRYAIPRGVKHIQGTVKTVSVDEDGITGITLDNGDVITADLYVDCTGWKSMLLGDALKEPFIPYNHILPNNRAWATQVPYIDKNEEIEGYTNCTAIENGWVWNIPLWSRIGTGYVYSDKFISKEDALEQFKQHLRTKMTIPNAERITDDLKFKDIEMRIGIHERPWTKNVVAIGLSCGFIEPLESNGLLTVHEFLLKLVKFLGRDIVSRWDQDTYNSGIRRYFHNFAEFVGLHYALSVRTDTEYWREISKRSFCPEMVDQIPTLSVGFADFAYRKVQLQEFDNTGGIHCIATGMRYPLVDESVVSQWQHYNPNTDYKKYIDEMIPIWNKEQRQYKREADDCPTIYEYLKNNIHG